MKVPVPGRAWIGRLTDSGRSRKQLAITFSVIFSVSILVAVLAVESALWPRRPRSLIDQRSSFFMDSDVGCAGIHQ